MSLFVLSKQPLRGNEKGWAWSTSIVQRHDIHQPASLFINSSRFLVDAGVPRAPAKILLRKTGRSPPYQNSFIIIKVVSRSRDPQRSEQVAIPAWRRWEEENRSRKNKAPARTAG
jgi:hypothetical protein